MVHDEASLAVLLEVSESRLCMLRSEPGAVLSPSLPLQSGLRPPEAAAKANSEEAPDKASKVAFWSCSSSESSCCNVLCKLFELLPLDEGAQAEGGAKPGGACKGDL